MADIDIAKPYHDAVSNLTAARNSHTKLVHDNLVAYDRYYDLAAKTTSELARSTYPAEAVTVDKIEEGAKAITAARTAMWNSLMDCMIEKMKQVSTEPVEHSRGAAQLMVDALQEVSQFRIEQLDGIDSKFDQIIEHGHGFASKERDRLINRLVSTWAKGHGIALKELLPLAEEWALAARQETAEQQSAVRPR